MVRAYLDASGQKTDPVVVVAGFLGWASDFERFEKQWLAFLSEFEIDHFHATEFWARKSRPYCNWSEAKHLKAQGDICKILSGIGPPLAISVALNVQAFKEWRHSLDHYYPSDPYYFCLDRVLYTLVYSTGSKDDEGITIYCDQEKEHELLGDDIARWHEARLNKDPSLATNPISEPRPVSVHYGPKRKFIPLQMADILANDTFKKVRDYLETGLLDEPYFTRCLRNYQKRELITYFYSDVRLLDSDYQYRFRNQAATEDV